MQLNLPKSRPGRAQTSAAVGLCALAANTFPKTPSHRGNARRRVRIRLQVEILARLSHYVPTISGNFRCKFDTSRTKTYYSYSRHIYVRQGASMLPAPHRQDAKLQYCFSVRSTVQVWFYPHQSLAGCN